MDGHDEEQNDEGIIIGRFLFDGTADATFAPGGFAVTPFGGLSSARDIIDGSCPPTAIIGGSWVDQSQGAQLTQVKLVLARYFL